MDDRCDPNELARLVRAGDVAALDQMTRCFGDRLHAVGCRCCRDADRARDAVQDALVAATASVRERNEIDRLPAGAAREKHLADYRGEGSLEAWLAKMTCNACKRMERGRKNAPHAPLDGLTSTAASPEDAAARRELQDRLERALEALSAMDRAILLLADGEGWTAPEIATRLGLGSAAVRTRLMRARRRLRARL